MCCVTPGSIRVVKSPLCSLNVSLVPVWFSSSNTLNNSAFWTSKGVGGQGGCFPTCLGLGFPDLKREVEYSGSSHVPTPLGLAKKDKTLSLYPSTPQA